MTSSHILGPSVFSHSKCQGQSTSQVFSCNQSCMLKCSLVESYAFPTFHRYGVTAAIPRLQSLFSANVLPTSLYVGHRSLRGPPGSARPTERGSIQARAATEPVLDQPPESREDSIRQAQRSLLSALDKALRSAASASKQKKASRGSKAVRVAVEIPTADNEPSSVASLAADIFSGLFDAHGLSTAGLGIYFADEKAAVMATKMWKGASTAGAQKLRGCHVASMRSLSALPSQIAVAVFVCPSASHVASAQRLLEGGGLRAAVAVNPEWNEDVSPEANSATSPRGASALNLVKSFEPCYSFLPLAIQILFTKSEGAVLRCFRSGPLEATPWLIFAKRGKELKCVMRMSKRPTPADLEAALYQSVAANSPVAQTIQFVKSLVPKKG
eukprot:TRINITY_DN17030_c0_g1_i1.p1 TRINITY_DN17030_c0_g1~~TRINITY_DN17030_c0_g1_i1.p1  ORF type:complete len:385 (-),score=19.87 TRINITY_DN17030_c0_g1_i1:1127-2281(-)